MQFNKLYPLGSSTCKSSDAPGSKTCFFILKTGKEGGRTQSCLDAMSFRLLDERG